MRTAVWIVMSREPKIRAYNRGLSLRYFCRKAIKPGISCSASSISLRPNATVAGERSLTLYGKSENTGSSVPMNVLLVSVVDLGKVFTP